MVREKKEEIQQRSLAIWALITDITSESAVHRILDENLKVMDNVVCAMLNGYMDWIDANAENVSEDLLDKVKENITRLAVCGHAVNDPLPESLYSGDTVHEP